MRSEADPWLRVCLPGKLREKDTQPLRRVLALTAMLLVMPVAGAVAQDAGAFGMISSTMGVHGGRLCVGEASRGDLGCPTYAPSLSTAGHVSVSGNVSANKFVGDGSELTGVSAATADHIVSGTTGGTRMVAISDTGYISITQAGANSGWFDPTRGLVTLGVSATGMISGTTGYFSGKLGVGTFQPGVPLEVVSSNNTQARFSGGATINPGNPSAGEIFIGSGAGGSGGRIQYAAFDASMYIDNAYNGTDNGDILFRTQTSGTPINVLTLKSAGNVGIGTIAPSATAHVSGSILVAGNDNKPCQAGMEGLIRRNATNGRMEVCE